MPGAGASSSSGRRPVGECKPWPTQPQPKAADEVAVAAPCAIASIVPASADAHAFAASKPPDGAAYAAAEGELQAVTSRGGCNPKPDSQPRSLGDADGLEDGSGGMMSGDSEDDEDSDEDYDAF